MTSLTKRIYRRVPQPGAMRDLTVIVAPEGLYVTYAKQRRPRYAVAWHDLRGICENAQLTAEQRAIMRPRPLKRGRR